MLSAIRSFVFVLWLAVTVIPWALAVVAASLFIRGDRLYWMCANWLAVAMWGCRVICGVRSRVHGMDNLPPADRQSPVILLSKHQSTWETFTYPTIMSHPLAYVFKRELLYIPFFGWAIGKLDMIHIDRSKRAQAFNKVVEQGKQILAHGSWIIMFPEGTRTPRGSQGQYKTGGTRLALATGAPVVPIAVTSARCWPRKSFLIRPGTIDISIGKPIPVEGRDADELMREVEAWIEAEMRRLDPQAYARAPG
ncbi:MAG TPA: lysophospholipid acyltransferase family protein [Burkholderiaceae bacterium]|nr:lysophospholipid acyltransferase family protein [Burkholderiaceae bacterium]